jgi:hypothetical protein
MKKFKILFSLFIAICFVTWTTSCGDDDDGTALGLAITALTATGTDITTGNQITKDLNDVSVATDVPPDAVFNITFNRDVDASTVGSGAFTLTGGGETIGTSTSASGNVVTLTPSENMVQGTDYTLGLSSAIRAQDGGAFTATTRSFKVAGRAPAVIPQESKLVVYLPLNGEVEDAMGHTVLNSEVTFAEDRFGVFNGSAEFNGTTNYIGVQYSPDMSNASTTVSYWMKLPETSVFEAHFGNTDEGTITQFVTFGIGGNNGTYHEWNRFTCCELGFDIDVLKYFTNHVNSGSASDLAGSHIEMKNEGNPGGDKVIEVDNVDWLREQTGKWVHIVTSWEATGHRKAFYINGVPSTVFELTPSAEWSLDAAIIDAEGIDADATNNKNLYLGSGVPFWANIQGNGIVPFRNSKAFAFKGQMDDFRMFSVALTDAEVMALYNAERP